MVFPVTGLAAAAAPAAASSGGLGSILDFGLGAASLFGGGSSPSSDIPPEILQAQVEAAQRANIFSKAAVDPNHPFAKNLSLLLREQQRREAVEQIQRMLMVNRRALARGDPGIGISPERADESRYHALARAFQLAGESSRQLASDRLLAASGASAKASSAFNPLTELYAAYGGSNAQRRADQFQFLAQGIPKLINVLGG